MKVKATTANVAALNSPANASMSAAMMIMTIIIMTTTVMLTMSRSLLHAQDNESIVYFATYDDKINHSMVFLHATVVTTTTTTILAQNIGTHYSTDFGRNDGDNEGNAGIDIDVYENVRRDTEWSRFYDLMLNWQGVCLVGVFCIFIVTTIVGNTLVILAVITTRRLKTVTNCFVMSLAIADLMVGIFVMPPAVAVHMIGSWQLGWILCDIWISLDVLLCTASILSLCAISVDRYLAVTQPLRYSRKRRSKRLALFMILIVWILALAITCPPMLGWYEPGRRDLNECRYNQNKGYVIFSAMGSFFIPMAVMIYVYGKISCVVASRHDKMTDIGVHNKKKVKRYTTADIDQSIDRDLAERELNADDQKRKKKVISNETVVGDVILFDSTDGANVSSCSLVIIPSTTTTATTSAALSTNGCYELTLTCPTKLQRKTNASTNMTASTTNERQQYEQDWIFDGPRSTAVNNTQLQEQQKPQQQQPLKLLQNSVRRSSFRQHQMQNTLVGDNACSDSLNTTPSHLVSTRSSPPAQPEAASLTHAANNTRFHHHNNQQQHHNQLHPIQHQHHSKSLTNRISSLKKENKTTQTLSIVVGGFIACWLPFFIYYLITPFLKEQQVSQPLAKALTWLGWFNSAINPFIYAFYSVDFRAAFWRLTCKRFLSTTAKPQFTSNTLMSIRR